MDPRAVLARMRGFPTITSREKSDFYKEVAIAEIAGNEGPMQLRKVAMKPQCSGGGKLPGPV
jgi:hypothetical protein